MSTYKVVYFNIRGRAEVSRILLAKNGIKFEDVRFEINDWPAYKAKSPHLPMGQVPILEVDGKVLWQSSAICQFLGKRFGMYGSNEFEESKILAIHMTMEDVLKIPFDVVFEIQDEEEKIQQQKKSKMSTYKVVYFNMRGRAEVSRILLAKNGIKFEDVRFEINDWPAYKAKSSHLPMGQVPILEVDGKVLWQSSAICRFLGKRFGMYGSNEFEESKILAIHMTMEDVLKIPFDVVFEIQDEEEKKYQAAKYKTKLAEYLGYFEKAVEGDGYFIGNKMTVADIAFFVYTEFFDLCEATYDWKDYPKLCKLIANVKSDPNIAEWLKNRPQTFC